MTRLWAPAEPISVLSRPTLAGVVKIEPGQFTWQGQSHTVDQITREWRVDIDWWRERTWRAYYKLSTDTGLLVIIYQDLLTNRWYFSRLYD